MPTFIDETDESQQPQPTLRLAPERYDEQVVDVRKEGYDSLATFYSGSKLYGDYYQKTEGADTAAGSYQKDIPLVYGQRRRINNFELILSGQLSHKQNTTDSMGFASTGEAVCYGVITPQPGDIFIAQVGNARNVMFQINTPERLTPFDESGFTVSIKAQMWMDKKSQNELNESVVDERWFSRENFRNGVKCLLTSNDLDVMKRLSSAYRRLIGTYLKEFFDDRYMTFMMPGQLAPSYDPNITRFMKKMISAGDFPKIVQVVELGVSDDKWSTQTSVLDAIIQRDEAVLYSSAHKWNLVSVGNYFAHPLMHSIYYSGVKWVVAPHDPKFTVGTQHAIPYTGIETIKADVLFKDIDYILPNLDLDEKEKLPEQRYINRVLVDDYYIFSKAFYEDGEGMSMLESLVRARLRHEQINLINLADLADYAMKFNNLERYYYIPIIINLIMRAPGVL